MAEILSAIFFITILALSFFRAKKIMPEKTVQYETGMAHSVGTSDVQQDYSAFVRKDDAVLMLLADGQGRDGNLAAKVAVDTFREIFETHDAIDKPQYFFRKASNLANKKIVGNLQGETSLAALLMVGEKLHYMVIGNSKIAIFRRGDLIPITEGQTIDILAKNLYKKGKITKQKTLALLSEKRRYNVLGGESFQEIEMFDKPLELQEKDIVVMMSEGVFKNLRWVEIENVLDKKISAQSATKEIIRLVNISPRKDKDNATIMLIKNKA